MADEMPARMKRFLANPPARISAKTVNARKIKNARRRPKAWLDALVKKQRNKCHYCSVQMTKHEGPRRATADHVIPLSRGGSKDRSNLVAACEDCNWRKGDKSAETHLRNLEMRRREDAIWASRLALGEPCRRPGYDTEGRRRMRLAQSDTHAKRGDVEQAPSLMGSGVAATSGDAPKA